MKINGRLLLTASLLGVASAWAGPNGSIGSYPIARDSTGAISHSRHVIYPPSPTAPNDNTTIWSEDIGYSGLVLDQDPDHSDLDFTRQPDGTLIAKGISWGWYLDPQYPGIVTSLRGANVVREDFVYTLKAGSTVCDLEFTLTDVYDPARIGFVYKHYKGQSSVCGIELGDQNVNQHPVVTITAPAADTSFSAPATIALSATASDSDGRIAKVEFFNGNVSIGIGTFSNGVYSFNWTGVPARRYAITAVATDNQGAASTSNLLTVVVSPAGPPRWYVRSDAADNGDGTSWSKAWRKIGDAVAHAKSGDEIWVAAGTYPEVLTLIDNVSLYGGFSGSETTRDQRNWRTNVSTIQTGNVKSGITFVSNDGVSGATVDGFTITNEGGANAFALVGTGGLMVANNFIHSASGALGGVEFISFTKGSTKDSVVLGNRITGFGAGVYLKGFSTHVTIANNILSKNAIGIFDSQSLCAVDIVNNSIVRNSAAGITRSYANYSLYNNIIAFTSGPGLSLIGAGLGGRTGSVVGSDNDSYGNTTNGVASDTDYPLPNDTHIAPQFVDDTTDFHLKPGSPAIDSGNDSRVIGATDAEGNARIYNQVDLGGLESQPSGPTAATPQIQPASGLYIEGVNATISCATPNAEIRYTLDSSVPNAASPLYTGPLTIGQTVVLKAKAFATGLNPSGVALASYNVPPTVFVKADAAGSTHDGRSWATAFTSIGTAIAQHPDNAQIWVAAGTYSESLAMQGTLFLYGGFAGNESSQMQRDWRRNTTRIATGNAVTGISFTASNIDKHAVIDGFTITNTFSPVSGNATAYIIGTTGGLTVSNNTIQSGTTSSGIYLGQSSVLPTADTVISGNRISGVASAIRAYGFYAHATIANNVLFSNVIGVWDDHSGCTLQIVNNTIVHNSYAGVLREFSSVHLFNNVVAFNTQYGLAIQGSGQRQVTGSTNNSFSNGTDTNQALTNDLHVDPKFVNKDSDFHLQGISPIINVGDNAEVIGTTDADNNPRRYNNGAVDLGAYEFQGDPTTSTNQPPTVVLTSPANHATFTAPATIALTATASDSDGTITKVEFFQGTTLLSTGTPANGTCSLSWTGVAAGIYSLTAKATDNAGATTTSLAVSITVADPSNPAPTIAQAASALPMTVKTTTTTLSVLGADANDGEGALTYTWSGPTGVAFSDNQSNGAKNTAATFSAAGVFPLTVTVRDPEGAIATSSVTVTVQQTLSRIDVTAPFYTFHPGDQQLFTGTQLDQFAHPMEVTAVLTWTTPSPSTIDQTGLLTVGQTLGVSSVMAHSGLVGGATGINIVAAAPPTITWIAPSNNATFASGDTIPVEVGAQAADGNRVTGVEFFADSQRIAIVTQAPYAFAWTGASVGSHVLTARATDSAGLTATTFGVTVIVTAPVGVLQSVTPSAASQEDPSPLLTIQGSDFTSDTSLLWDGQLRSTVFVDATHLTLQLTRDDLAQAKVHTLALVGGSGLTTFEVVALVTDLRFDDLPSLVLRNATIRASGANATSYVFEFFPRNASGSANAGIARAGGFTAASVNGVLALNSVSQLIAGQSYHVQVTAANRLGKLSRSVDADIVIVGDDYSALRVFPNPYRTDKDTGGKITFDRMTPNSTVKLFTISGQFVKTLDGASGLATWDLTTDGGDKAASGIYLYLITNPQGQKAKGKLAVVR